MALWEERSGRWDAHSHQDLEQCCLKVGNSWGPGEKPRYPGCTPNLSESGFSGAEPGTQYFNKSLVSLMTEQAWGLEIQFLVSAVKKLPRWLRARSPEPCPGLGHLGKFAGQRAGGRLCPPDFLYGKHLTWASAASAWSSIPALLLNLLSIHIHLSKPQRVCEAFSSNPAPHGGHLLPCSLSL